MEFLNYDKLINDKKKDIIDSYVKQYGEDFRTLIESKFNDIRFCFFETPKRIRDYIDEKSFEDGKQITLEFLEELGFDTSTIYDDFNLSIKSTDSRLNGILNAFFPTFHYMTLTDMNRGIFAYFNGSEITKSNFKFSIAGLNLSEEKIKHILYILEKYKQKYLNLYTPLIAYAEELDKKIENLIEQYKERGKNSEQDKIMLRYEIAKLCIINNFDLDEFEIGVGNYKILYPRKLDLTIVTALATYEKNKNGQYVPIVYISPLDQDYEFLDVSFDHETRHALEYSIIGNIEKCGLKLKNLDTGEKRYHYINEIMTQKLSIENTLDRQKRGIYIFPHQRKYVLGHCDYDEYLDVITKHFPYSSTDNFFVQCRLMENLDSLYDYYSEEELNRIDSEILPEIQEITRSKGCK